MKNWTHKKFWNFLFSVSSVGCCPATVNVADVWNQNGVSFPIILTVFFVFFFCNRGRVRFNCGSLNQLFEVVCKKFRPSTTNLICLKIFFPVQFYFYFLFDKIILDDQHSDCCRKGRFSHIFNFSYLIAQIIKKSCKSRLKEVWLFSWSLILLHFFNGMQLII